MSEDSLLGVQLDEYRLESLLGRGGMARVYRGLDTGLNRYVAVKVIDTPHRGDEEYVKRFKIEAQAIARLDHPHVVRLYRYGEAHGVLYMAMQFIEGADLGFLLESYRLDGEFIPSADALRLVSETCQALDYIHAHGIIHRDIKPSNIMLTRDEARVVLADFGLALRAEVGTRGEVFGSPHYIAPEQAVSSARSVPQSDLYALGVILYEMFTGVLPFNAADPMDIAVMHMSSPPTPPREIRPELSEEVEAVILKALEKTPEDRYQSGRALALALERSLRRQPAPEPPANRSIPERVTIGLAANPLPALPPIPAVVTPPKPVSAVSTAADRLQPDGLVDQTGDQEPATMQFLPADLPGQPVPPTLPPAAPPEPAAAQVIAEPAGQPISMEHESQGVMSPAAKKTGGGAVKKPAAWILAGVAGIIAVCLLACLATGGIFLFLRSSQSASVENPQSGEIGPQPAEGGLVTAAPTFSAPNSLPAGAYRLKFWRCENEGCLVIENSGSETFPLNGLMLKGKEGGLSENAWAIDALQPGQCVKLVKEEEWITRMPEGVACEMVGYQVLREKKERFWNNSFTVYFEEQEIADCMKKGSWCEVLIPR